MEGSALDEAPVKDPPQDSPDKLPKDTVIPNGVNGSYNDDNEELLDSAREDEEETDSISQQNNEAENDEDEDEEEEEEEEDESEEHHQQQQQQQQQHQHADTDSASIHNLDDQSQEEMEVDSKEAEDDEEMHQVERNDMEQEDAEDHHRHRQQEVSELSNDGSKGNDSNDETQDDVGRHEVEEEGEDEDEVEEEEEEGEGEESQRNARQEEEDEEEEEVEHHQEQPETMEIDSQSNNSDVECLDESITEIHQSEMSKSDAEEEEEEDDEDEDQDDPKDGKKTNDSVEIVESSSDAKVCEENGSCESPDIEEITSENMNDSGTKSNGTNESSPEKESESEDKQKDKSPKEPPKKKSRKTIDLSTITPRRSTRNIKRTSYAEKDHIDEPSPPTIDDSSDIEEIKPEDPLAGVDSKDKENSKMKSPLKNNKTTIVVNDTKRLVEIAAGSKSMKGGKKEPTLVIIDTNSILSGRGGVPIGSNSGKHHHHHHHQQQQQQHHHHHHHQSSHSLSGTSSFSIVPTNLQGHQSIYPNMRTTITPVPMSSKSAAQLSPKTSASSSSSSSSNSTSTVPILPTLTDDMFVVEAPSFIVPYVYEKPPIKPLKEFVTKLADCIKEKEREEDEKEKEEDNNEDEGNKSKEDHPESEKVKKDLEADNESDDNKEKSGEDAKKGSGGSTGGSGAGAGAAGAGNSPQTYFDLPLGKFFMQIGVNLVQEFVQTDLLRTQKRKQGKGSTSAETQIAINSLIKNLEFSKENNEPFHLELKKCEFCSFKTESDLVMQHHLETPHMRNYVYKCNFCTLEVRSPHDILFHMEAEHNTRGRLERGPAFHQCPNCPFEDNQKGKLTRHILACTKKFRPERNLEPSSDWEPPAKIPRLNRSRNVGGPGNSNALAMALASGGKGQQPLLPKLLPAPNPPRGRGRPPMQPRYTDIKSLRTGTATTGMRQDNVAGMVYRPTSGLLVPPGAYQLGSNQLFQNSSTTVKNPAAKLLSQPSISITPLPRTTTQTPVSGSGSSSKPGGKNTFVICEICDGYIKDLEQLRNHMQWIHKVKIHPKMIYNRPPLNCQKCQFRFFTDQGLERHLLGSHGLVTSSMQEAANKGKDAGRCPACGRVYQWKLLNHVARDHGMTLKPAHLSYKCTVCTATFGMYKQFENHVYSAHSVVAKRVMDKKSAPSSPSSRSNDSLLKPLKINDEITIIPQPAKTSSRSSGGSSQGRSK